MTRRSLPLFALLCLSLAAPSLAFAADKADAKKKAAKKAPEKKAEPEPEDAAFQNFIDGGQSSSPSSASTQSTAKPAAAEPKAESKAEPKTEQRTETRQVEASSADMSPPPEEEKPKKAAPASPPSTGPRTVGHAGAYIALGAGYNSWSLSRATVSDQVGSLDDTSWMFDASLQNGAAAGLRGGYNILGHAHIGFNFMGTGWDVFTKERGGGGYIGGEVGWHPLSLIFALVSDQVREKSGQKYYDLFFEGGAGFGIVGKHRAMQGGVGTIGLGTEAYPAPWVSVGFRANWYYPFFNEYILNYDERTQPGNTIALPKGSGGRFLTCTGYLAFHFGMPEGK